MIAPVLPITERDHGGAPHRNLTTTHLSRHNRGLLRLRAGLSRGWSMLRASFSVSSRLYGLEHYYGVSGITALETAMTVTTKWAGLSFESSLQRQ